MNKYLYILIVISLLCACSGQRSTERREARPAELEFYQISDVGSNVRIFWHETPYLSDTQMQLQTPLSQCAHVALYANPTTENPNRLGQSPITVTPRQVKDQTEELAQWSRLPHDPCGVLVTAGYIKDVAFMGLSFSTRQGVFFRQYLRLTRDKLPGEFLSDTQVALALLASSNNDDKWRDKEMTVSFDFPDGHREEITLSFHRAVQLLDGPYYRESQWNLKTPWIFARFWIRAAMAGLNLDFREQVSPDARGYFTLKLSSVNGFKGDWQLDTRDGRPPTDKLYTLLEESPYIRLSLVKE